MYHRSVYGFSSKCYVTRYTPLAFPLGELSPKVTEREKAPFLNAKLSLSALSVLAALGHLSHRERQVTQARRAVRVPASSPWLSLWERCQPYG